MSGGINSKVIKNQGKRTDLIKHVEALLAGAIEHDNNSHEKTDTITCTPPGNKSIGITGEKYGLSKNSVARYIRVNNLISEFKEHLDSEELSFRAGVSLSYLDEEQQKALLSQTQQYDVIPSMIQAEQLKKLAAETHDETGNEKFLLGCTEILTGKTDSEKPTKPKKVISFKLQRSAVEAYFEEDATEEAIQSKVLEALQFHHRFYNQYQKQ